jgi:hypothetical protein
MWILMLGRAFADEPISSGATVLTGVGATFDGNPATLRLEVQGEVPLEKSKTVGLGLVLALEGTTSGQETFGLSTSNTMFTFLPMLRVRALNTEPVRFYGDAGIGLAQITATNGWLFDSNTAHTGWTTRTALGLEVGAAKGGVAFIAEPVGFDTLNFGDSHSAGYIARIGVGVRN